MAIDVLRLPSRPRERRLIAVAPSALLAATLVGGAMVVAALLRLHALDAQSFWQDEGLSVWIAQKNVPEILRWLHEHSVHPPLYFVLLHLWMRISTSVEWIRLLSVVPSVLTVPFAYGLAKRLFRSDSVGVVTAVLVAVSPFNVYYGQEARMYSLLSLGTVAASFFLVAALQTDRQSAWAAYAVAGTVVVYTQNVGVFVLVAHGLILVTLALWRRREAVHGLVALVAVLVLWTPWLPAVLGQTEKGGATWVTNPSPADVRDLAESFTSYVLPLHVDAPVVGDLRLGSSTRGFLPPVAAAAVLGYLVVALLGLLSLRRRRRWLFVAAVLVVGPITFEVDQGIVAPVFIDRTLIFVSVVYLMAIAAGLVVLTRKPRGRSGALS
jgi:mannosyltransferase